MFIFMILSTLLILIIMFLFFSASKMTSWNLSSSSTFECGFSSYFFSRYSFSMHYFVVGIIFLFLDLELCFLMPFFNGEYSSTSTYSSFSFFIFILITGVILEWKLGQLEWKF